MNVPPPWGPPVPPPRPRWGLWVALGSVAALLVIAAGAGLGVYLGRSSGAESEGGTYRAVDDLCTTVDLGPVTEVYPTKTGNRHSRTDRGAQTDLHCELDLQSTIVAVALVLDASVFHGGSAAGMYDGRRRTVQEHGARFDQPAPRAVPGLGRAAFSGSEWGKGIQVVGFDGNLYFELSWLDTGHPEQVPPDIVDRLIRLARNVMVVLKD